MKNPPKRQKRGWGEGSIDELPSGQFRARGSVVDRSTGQRKRVARVFPNIDAARSWLASLRVDKDKGVTPSTSPLTLAEWAGEWLLSKKSSTGAGNFANYDLHLRCHILPSPGSDPHDPTHPLPALGPVKLRDLTAARLKRWLADLEANGRSAATRRKVCVTLGVMLNDAVREGKLPGNPLKKVPKPKKEKAPVEVWTEDELRRFLAAARKARLFPLLLLLADTGCRPGEALGLHWPDVDLDRGTVRIRFSLEEVGTSRKLKEPKSEAGRRVVSISAATVQTLAAWREAERGEGRDCTSSPVFLTTEGEFYAKQTVRGAFRRAVRDAKVPRRHLYALRHTSATLLLAAGVNVRTVSRRLGHEDIDITLRHYAGWLPDADEQAAEVMGGILGGPEPKSGKKRKK